MEKTLLHWELSVLSRSIDYANLSAASAHVGLSQPQLSRIVAKLEADLGVVLLDRSARRKSGWTAEARKLAEIYQRSCRGLQAELSGLADQSKPARIVMGTLEGLVDVAAEIGQGLFERGGIQTLELDIYDLNDLESLFLNGTLDLILSSRDISQRKFKYFRMIGIQTLQRVQTSSEVQIMSLYDYGRAFGGRQKKPVSRFVLSNSLAVRRLWLERFGGTCLIPSKVEKVDGKKKRASAQLPPESTECLVHLFGADRLSSELWSVAISN